MAPLSVAGILKELDDVVGDQLQVVTYKWLGRRYNVPYDTAKRILFEFVTRHPQKVKATFLLSGWGEAEDGAPARHVVRVVEGQQLEAEKAKLSVVTGMHVYSVQPGVPKDAGDLYNTDYAQTLDLFRQLLASSAAEAEGNPLASNLLNTVQCPGVRFDPALAARRPRPASAAPAPASGGAAKPLGSAAAAAKPAAPAALPPGKAAGKAGAAAKSPAGKPSGGAGKKGAGSGSAMAAMWSKAGEKSKAAKAARAASEEPAAQPEAAPPAPEREGQQQAAPKGKGKPAAKPAAKAAAKPAVKPAAKAAAPLPASDDSWEDSEEEEEAVFAVGHNKGKKSRQLLEESESEGEHEAPPAKRGKASKAGEDGGKKETGGKKAAGGSKRKKPANGEEAGGGGDGSDGGGDEAAPPPAGPKWGSVKVRDPEPGAKRVRREMRTFYNDAGEEVTELVEVEEEEASPAPAQKHPQQQQQQQQQQPQQAPKPAPKPAAKPAAGSGGSKKGGKGAPPPGQKGIMSFFGKK